MSFDCVLRGATVFPGTGRQADVAMIDHFASEEAVRAIFRHPRAFVGSDGIFGARPHPRLCGPAARVLGRYALREDLISVEEAVARLTAGQRGPVTAQPGPAAPGKED